MGVYLGHSFYRTMAAFGKIGIHFQKHRKVDEVASALIERFQIKYERYSYPPGAYRNYYDSLVSDVRYKWATERLEQMVEDDAVKETDEGMLKKSKRR